MTPDQTVVVTRLADRQPAVAEPTSRGFGTMSSWPPGGGQCGMLIRERDWAGSGLGDSRSWSPSLCAAIATVVNAPVATVLMWGPDRLVLYNDACRAIVGGLHPAALGQPFEESWPALWSIDRLVLERALAGEPVACRDHPITVPRDGVRECVAHDLFCGPVYALDGAVGGLVVTLIDNAARVAAETALVCSETELGSIANALPVLVSRVDREHRYRFANSAYLDWLGIPPAQIVGRHVRDLIGEEAYALRRAMLDRALAGESVTFEEAMPHRDGRLRQSEIRYLPRLDGKGLVDSVHILVVDVDERVRRAKAQSASNTRFRAAVDAVHGILWVASADGDLLDELPGWQLLTGQTPEQFLGNGWTDAVHPDDRAHSIAAWEAALASQSPYVVEQRVRRHDGVYRSFAVRSLPVFEDGRVVEWVGVHTDITHRRAAEQALRSQADTLARQVAHRQRAEEQLRQLNEELESRVVAEITERRAVEGRLAQAQKLETVGKLTGGVAHDFNNLLQVVSGNLQLLSKDIAGNNRAERRVGNALSAVSRGSKLASQLLAFGRRQALEPKVVNVTRFVQGMDDILRRAIGDAIEVETSFGGGLWNTFVDPNQIENALLNLAINARDAMQERGDGHGRLTIELRNVTLDEAYARLHDEVQAGQYVMLAVSDTGSGMAPEIIDRVFEPFFSTKAEGKGSGLGLSMVYGFVKQSGGHVKIYSEVGHGTTIRLYLPRALQAEDIAVVVDTGPVTGGTETVLVVEDDAEVRATVVELLSDLGYRVLKAVDAASGLSVIESGIPIDLLFTDVVMPGALKSPEMARQARERLPDLAVLFTSGYTENSIVHGGRLDAGVELLSKPYTREALARKLRHVLANQAQRRQVPQRPPVGRPSMTAPSVSSAAGSAGTVLLVEDDALIRANTAEMLIDHGFVVIKAGTAEQALVVLQTSSVTVLVTDINLPGAQGPELAARARAMLPGLGIVFASGDAAPLMRGELLDTTSLPKPYDADALIAAVRRAMVVGVQSGAVLAE